MGKELTEKIRRLKASPGWEDRLLREMTEPVEGRKPPLFRAKRLAIETFWTPDGERDLYEKSGSLLIAKGGYSDPWDVWPGMKTYFTKFQDSYLSDWPVPPQPDERVVKGLRTALEAADTLSGCAEKMGDNLMRQQYLMGDTDPLDIFPKRRGGGRARLKKDR